MCGIAGIINYHDYDLNRFTQALRHRGPDDQTIHKVANVALMHTRLAIQDIALGKQPFIHQQNVIIFNGEIYNHLNLRKYLTEFEFKTQSDTETLLYLFQKYRERLFNMVDGMFAFCIYDHQKNSLFFARDRAGKKPLYYTKQGKSFIFASELNAIKQAGPLPIDENAIGCYLRAGFFYNDYTPYRDVKALPAGTYMEVDIEHLSTRTTAYFNMLDEYTAPKKAINLDQALIEADQILQTSVQSRLLSSDIEVGVFLSGGIDSNLVAATASRIRPRIKTFTVKFPGSYDESHLAKMAAVHYGTSHHELEISVNLKNDVEKILIAYGAPFMDSSAIPSYYVAAAARRHVGVVLNGDGADELFGGYRRYVTVAHAWLKWLRPFTSLKKLIPRPSQKQSYYNYFYRLLNMADKKALDFYLAATTDIYEEVIRIADNPIITEMQEHVRYILERTAFSGLNQLLYLDFSLLFFSDLLVKMDIATMSHSLEARSPFLSASMLQFAPRLPDHYKIKGVTTKVLLRQLAQKYLPQELVHQPKRGFEVPLSNWIENDLNEQIRSYLVPGCYSENYLTRDFIQSVLHNKILMPKEKRAKILWNLFCLEVWRQNEEKNTIRENI